MSTHIVTGVWYCIMGGNAVFMIMYYKITFYLKCAMNCTMLHAATTLWRWGTSPGQPSDWGNQDGPTFAECASLNNPMVWMWHWQKSVCNNCYVTGESLCTKQSGEYLRQCTIHYLGLLLSGELSVSHLQSDRLLSIAFFCTSDREQRNILCKWLVNSATSLYHLTLLILSYKGIILFKGHHFQSLYM